MLIKQCHQCCLELARLDLYSRTGALCFFYTYTQIASAEGWNTGNWSPLEHISLFVFAKLGVIWSLQCTYNRFLQTRELLDPRSFWRVTYSMHSDDVVQSYWNHTDHKNIGPSSPQRGIPASKLADGMSLIAYVIEYSFRKENTIKTIGDSKLTENGADHMFVRKWSPRLCLMQNPQLA